MRKAGQKHVIDRASQHAALHPESRLCAFDLCIGLAKNVIDRASQNAALHPASRLCARDLRIGLAKNMLLIGQARIVNTQWVQCAGCRVLIPSSNQSGKVCNVKGLGQP
jgi:hypothetical protein